MHPLMSISWVKNFCGRNVGKGLLKSHMILIEILRFLCLFSLILNKKGGSPIVTILCRPGASALTATEFSATCASDNFLCRLRVPTIACNIRPKPIFPPGPALFSINPLWISRDITWQPSRTCKLEPSNLTRQIQ